MNKPWWLWEGAAVRFGCKNSCIGEIDEFRGESFRGDQVFIEVTWHDHGVWQDIATVTPIENPAVMLAPEWATEVAIDKTGFCCFMYGIGEYENDLSSFLWPQCPDHLKGKTWELPR